MSKSLALPALLLAMGFSAGAFAQEQYAPPPQPQGPPGAYYPGQQPGGYPPPAPGYQQQAPAYPQQPPAYPQAPGYPPPAYDDASAPPAPPGAVWVGAPGECLYANGSVYWCAPGVVFSGFPAWWDFGRYPVVGFGAGIIVDPIWFGGWRGGHPGFAFRGRFASDGERRAFIDHRAEFVREGAPPSWPRYGRPEEHRDDHHDDHH